MIILPHCLTEQISNLTIPGPTDMNNYQGKGEIHISYFHPSDKSEKPGSRDKGASDQEVGNNKSPTGRHSTAWQLTLYSPVYMIDFHEDLGAESTSISFPPQNRIPLFSKGTCVTIHIHTIYMSHVGSQDAD